MPPAPGGTAATIQAEQTASGCGVLLTASDPFACPSKPNILDFRAWLLFVVEITTAQLPLGSQWPVYALQQALGLVVTAPFGIPAITYTLAVYNCATHILLGMAPDQPGQNFFRETRAGAGAGFGLVVPSTGLVAATSDESTSTTLSSPDWTKKIMVTQLGFMRTPWGREYLGYAQSAGPNATGLS